LEDRLNKWLHLLGDKNSNAYIHFNQDANIYVSEVDAGRMLKVELNKDRQAYLKVMEGNVKIGDMEFAHGDAAEITGDTQILALKNSHVMLIEMNGKSE
jgi:redox-sensitive bicupin YhaK (pirin superfamily)